MARRVFFSFHYDLDSWRVQQVKNMGVVEGQPLLSANKWEEVEAKGDQAIKDYIEKEMSGKSCNVVLIGSKTSERRWVKYEIKKAWNDGKGVVGVYIHNLKDKDGYTSTKGANPFALVSAGDGTMLDSYVTAHNPSGATSTDVYNTIKNNLERWVEDAINARK